MSLTLWSSCYFYSGNKYLLKPFFLPARPSPLPNFLSGEYSSQCLVFCSKLPPQRVVTTCQSPKSKDENLKYSLCFSCKVNSLFPACWYTKISLELAGALNFGYLPRALVALTLFSCRGCLLRATPPIQVYCAGVYNTFCH